MTTNVLTVTEAVRNFSDYVGRVAYRNEMFILRKGNKRVAELRPLPNGRRLGDLPSILRNVAHLPKTDVASFAEDVEFARNAMANMGLRNPWASCK